MKYFLSILLMATWVEAAAQNLVYNASFELKTACPNALGEVFKCTGWRQYTSGGTSDYFHDCGAGPVGAPVNVVGSQYAADGDAYMGIITYVSSTSVPAGVNYKEYIAGTITPLQVGSQYEVSMSVSLADTVNWAANDMGVFFYDSGPNTVPGNGVLSVTPQVSYSSYGNISNKTTWTRVSALFIADSAYDNIVIGGFTLTNNMTPSQVSSYSSVNSHFAYYYIDSITIRKADTLAINFNAPLLCGTDSFLVNYYAQTGLFTSNNVFTVQLSNASGSFASPVNIGSKTGNASGTIKVALPSGLTPGTGYRMRIVSGNIPFTSSDNGTNITIGMSAPAKPVITSNTPLCTGSSALNLSASTTSTVTGWSWTGPNSFTGNTSSLSVSNPTTAASGNYIVKAYNYGCFASDTEAVSVVQSPNPVTAGSNSPVCASDTIKLTATNNLTGASYGWTGPNGFAANTRNTNITPALTSHIGDYIVTVTLNGCVKKDTVTVQVTAMPAGLTAGSNTPVCEGDTIRLTATSTTPVVSYSWTGPNGFSATAQNPEIGNTSGANTGDYIVTCTNANCPMKDTVTVLVKALPNPVIASNSGPVCNGSNFTLFVTTGFTGTSFSWNGPAGFNSTMQNPSLTSTLTLAGDYIVTASLNGCSKKDTTTLAVKPVPAATASFSGNVCAGLQITLSGGSSLTGSAFSWTGPGSFSSTQQNPVLSPVIPAQSGNYSVTATLNGCTSAPAMVNILVYPIPATPTAASNSPVCAGGTLNLSANSSTTGVNYNWTGPNGFASSVQNPGIPIVSLNAGGVYSVTAEANGCISPANATTVVINNVSSLAAYPSPNDTLCINNANASFVAVPFNAGASPQYQWFKNNNAIGGATNITYPATGIADGDSFYCRMTVIGLCADPLVLFSNKVGMTVLPLTSGPSVTITADPGTLLSPWQLVKFTAVASNAGAIPKYQWKRNSQDVIGANADTWSANNLSNGDTISCVVTSDNWCASPSSVASNRMVVNIKTGIADIDADRKLELYPNPNNGSFVVYLPLAPSIGGRLDIDVVNAIGQIVYQATNQPANQSTIQIPNSQFQITLPPAVANGVYLLKLQADGVVYHARFTVSR